MGIGIAIKRWGHGKQHVRTAFDSNQQYSHLAMEALLWSLEDRGIDSSDEVLAEAVLESDKYPTITVRQFVEGYFNRRLQSGLR